MLGFLLGTWGLVNGFHVWITGQALAWRGFTGPWPAWGAVAAGLGALWMMAGNLCLFKNRRSDRWLLGGLAVVSVWNAGAAALVPMAILVLLLLDAQTK